MKEAQIKLHRTSSCGSLENLVVSKGTPDQFGSRTKSVLRDGKIVSEQTSSQENALNQSAGRSHRGVKVYQPREVSPRKSKGGNDAYTLNFASQIKTLPGSRYREEYIQEKVRKQRPDNSSQITTLPGCLIPQIGINYANPGKRFVRCTNTTQEAEDTVGVQVAKCGPKKSTVPVKNGLPAYQSMGTEVLDVRTHKGRLTRREHQQSLAEEDFHKSIRGRPDTLTDAFAVTFKLF